MESVSCGAYKICSWRRRSYRFPLLNQNDEKTHGSCGLKNKIVYPVQGGDDDGPVELEFEERRDRILIGWERGWDGSVGDEYLGGPTGQGAITMTLGDSRTRLRTKG